MDESQIAAPPRLRGGRCCSSSLFAAAAVVAALLEPLPPALSGRATVADGDTLRLGDERIRLIGLDAPELDQTCIDADGAAWPCGRELEPIGCASSSTADAVQLRRPKDRDRYGRYLGRCTVGGDDLGAVARRRRSCGRDSPPYAQRGSAGAARDSAASGRGRSTAPRQWRDTHGDTAAGFDLLGLDQKLVRLRPKVLTLTTWCLQ